MRVTPYELDRLTSVAFSAHVDSADPTQIGRMRMAVEALLNEIELMMKEQGAYRSNNDTEKE